MVDRGEGSSPVAKRVVERLICDYGGAVPTETVRDVVIDAGHDLAGQVPCGALPELLHRLASARLARICAK